MSNNNVYQSVLIVGRIGQANARTSKAGKEYVRVSVATRPGLGDDTLWVDVILYGGLVEVAKAIDLDKGDLVAVQGKLQAPRVHENVAYLQVIADEVRLLHRTCKATPAPAAETEGAV